MWREENTGRRKAGMEVGGKAGRMDFGDYGSESEFLFKAQQEAIGLS